MWPFPNDAVNIIYEMIGLLILTISSTVETLKNVSLWIHFIMIRLQMDNGKIDMKSFEFASINNWMKIKTEFSPNINDVEPIK